MVLEKIKLTFTNLIIKYTRTYVILKLFLFSTQR